MSKSAVLKKKFKKALIIFFIAIAVSGACAYGAYMYSESTLSEKQKMKSALAQKRLKVTELEQKFNIYESSFNRYNELLADFKKGRYHLNIAEAQKIIDSLRQQYRITNLELKISGNKPYGETTQNYQGFEPQYREVNLTFYGLSDAHIYAFVQKLSDSLSGYVRFAQFDISRQRPMSDTLYQDVRRGSTPSIVQAEISFLWIGIVRKAETS